MGFTSVRISKPRQLDLFNWMLQDFQEEKPLKITGPPDKVEFAKQRVEQVFLTLNLRRLG